MSLERDARDAISVLSAHKVRFVVIGGIAAVLLGSPQLTFDLDVCYARDPDNFEALAAALRELGARLRGAPENLPFQLDAETLRNGDSFTFATEAGNVDVLGTPLGTTGYSQLMRDAWAATLGGVDVAVASLDMLIRMKEAAGRPKDRAALESLYALRDRLENPR